jgi:hypothetical protein
MKESFGLFDYDSKNTNEDMFEITGICKAVRKGGLVEMKKLAEDLDKTTGVSTKVLATIGKIRKTYWVYSNCINPPEANDELWLALRNYTAKEGIGGIQIQLEDIIKLGKCKFVVKEFSIEPIKEPEVVVQIMSNNEIDNIRPAGNSEILATQLPETIIRDPTEHPKESKAESKKPAKEDEIHCRICLGSENTESDPLISSPCKCIGSVKLIHFNCMRQWLCSKITERKTQSTVSYVWKDLECDVCKTKYPSIFYDLIS